MTKDKENNDLLLNNEICAAYICKGHHEAGLVKLTACSVQTDKFASAVKRSND